MFLTTRKRARWRYKAGKDISGGGQEGEIDLLAWTPNSPDELLLIEYKAALEAAEIHEVNEVTAQTQEGQQQLRRCVDILTALTPRQKHAIYPFVPWETIRSIYGIVITSGGTISAQIDCSMFPAITREAIAYDLRSNDFMTPRRLWAACRDREPLDYFEARRQSVDIGTARRPDVSHTWFYLSQSPFGGQGVTASTWRDRVNRDERNERPNVSDQKLPRSRCFINYAVPSASHYDILMRSASCQRRPCGAMTETISTHRSTSEAGGGSRPVGLSIKPTFALRLARRHCRIVLARVLW